MDDEPDNPNLIPPEALDRDGWKALALRWKQRADAAEQQARESWQAENERRAGLGLPPLDRPEHG